MKILILVIAVAFSHSVFAEGPTESAAPAPSVVTLPIPSDFHLKSGSDEAAEVRGVVQNYLNQTTIDNIKNWIHS